MQIPDSTQKYPLENYQRLGFLKNFIQNPNIEVGDYTYYDDFERVENFEKNVKYHFDFIGDKLIIGKFCQIASGVSFIMNGANHRMNSATTFPFEIFGGAWSEGLGTQKYPYKGDTRVGNDVWIGHQARIMPGIQIGDGAIISSYATVVKDVAPYSIVGGNPAQEIRKRFEEAQIEKLLALQWWDWELEKITRHRDLLCDPDLGKLDALL